MNDASQKVECPKCQTVVVAEPGWRMVQCSRCGEMITRMAEDSSYD
jgi:endogenous inhibitor of DNA gyrase (YacG/DUF329 family)